MTFETESTSTFGSPRVMISIRMISRQRLVCTPSGYTLIFTTGARYDLFVFYNIDHLHTIFTEACLGPHKHLIFFNLYTFFCKFFTLICKVYTFFCKIYTFFRLLNQSSSSFEGVSPCRLLLDQVHIQITYFLKALINVHILISISLPPVK